jgi:hypothetical protein
MPANKAAAMAKDLKLMGRILKKLVVVDLNQILYIVGSAPLRVTALLSVPNTLCLNITKNLLSEVIFIRIEIRKFAPAAII